MLLNSTQIRVVFIILLYVTEQYTATSGVHFSPFVLLNSEQNTATSDVHYSPFCVTEQYTGLQVAFSRHQLRTVTEILENINNVQRSCTQRMI